MGYSTMSTSTGFSFIDPMRVNPCMEKSVMFPDTAYVQPKGLLFIFGGNKIINELFNAINMNCIIFWGPFC
jgi:hypothetical protein